MTSRRLTGRAYLDARGISLTRRSGWWRYTRACDTDIRRTFRRWHIETGVPIPGWLDAGPGPILLGDSVAAEAPAPAAGAPPAKTDLPPALRRQVD